MIYWDLMKGTNQSVQETEHYSQHYYLYFRASDKQSWEVFASQTNNSSQLVPFSELVELVHQIRLNRVKQVVAWAAKISFLCEQWMQFDFLGQQQSFAISVMNVL